jgi:hypothetical protein
MKAALFSPLIMAAIILWVPPQATAELANQDAAFSLLIEAFGEVQGALIESDYQRRLESAESIADPVARGHVCELAKQERELRLGKLKRQVAELALAYHYSRRTDERDHDANVRERIGPAATARKLERFILIGVATIDTGSGTGEPAVDERRGPWP